MIKERYFKFFHLQEWQDTKGVQWLVAVLIFHGFLAIYTWESQPFLTKDLYDFHLFTCPPYLQNCDIFYPLAFINYAWGHGFIFILALLAITGSTFFYLQKKWVECHFLLLLFLIWRVLITWVFTSSFFFEYEYFSIPFYLIVLFCPQKFIFSRFALAFLYFLAAKVKIHDSWITGTYFTSTESGLPGVTSNFAPIIGQLAILLELFGSLALLRSRTNWLYFWLFLWIGFHAYSVFLVGMTFPSYILPLLLVLFYFKNSSNSLHLTWKKTWGGFSVLFFLLALNLVQNFIPGDEKYSQEGRGFGSSMVDANHQCLSRKTLHFKDKTFKKEETKNRVAQFRCSPYEYWFLSKKKCEREPNIERIEWQLFHSINGGPFYKIVDTSDLCTLEYKNFVHNSWIILPEEGASILGYPSPGLIRPIPYIGLTREQDKLFYEKEMIALSPVQQYFRDHITTVQAAYYIIWTLVLVFGFLPVFIFQKDQK